MIGAKSAIIWSMNSTLVGELYCSSINLESSIIIIAHCC